MTPMTWNVSFSVGHPLLDSDHRILIDLLTQLFDATETGQAHSVVDSVLGVLAEYTEHHFRREETLLLQAGYPHLEEHRDEHRGFERRLRELTERRRAGERGVLNEQVADLLKKWLTEHIQVSDNSYRPWMERVMGGGRIPAPAEQGDGVNS